MTSSVDTNVIVALWDADGDTHTAALDMLDAAAARGGIVICGAVFAELLACPGRTENFLDRFAADAGIVIDWATSESMWRTASRAFRAYADRRRKQGAQGPRRILADFLIGAHAVENGYRLLTLDDGVYRKAFPSLTIIRG